jgi:CDGSH-type Zn-finger protein
VRGLPAVFDTSRRPWILPDAADADAIAAVVAACPSGALHFARRDGGAEEPAPDRNTIVPRPRGPLYVRGRVQLRAADGSLLAEDSRMALCRCGQSGNKPFCDNSHRAAGFDDPGVVADAGQPVDAHGDLTIVVRPNGPYQVQGAFTLRGAGGQGICHSEGAKLCRCGGSANKPFCDGTHRQIGFRSEENASE